MNENTSQSESLKEYSADAVFHWSDLLPPGFVQFLEQQDLLGDTPSDVLENLDESDISPRTAEIHNIREGRTRIERITQVIGGQLYIDENNIALDVIMGELQLPEALRVEVQNILSTHKNVKTLADIFILGERELRSYRFPEGTFSSESLQSLYDLHILPILLKESSELMETDDDENEDTQDESNGGTHHYHYPKKGISIFTALTAAGVLALIAQERGYIDIHKTPIKQDMRQAIDTVRSFIHHVFGRN